MTVEVNEMQEKKLTEKIVDFGKDSVCLGLGVVDVVQENVQELFKRGNDYRHNLIERGTKVREKNINRMNEFVEKPQSVAKDTFKKASDTFDKYSEEVLTRIHVPTVDQFETISKKVASVDKKLDKVIKENTAAERI